MIKTFFAITLILQVTLVSGVAWSSTNKTKLFEEAEAKRITNPIRFDELLTMIKKDIVELSKRDKDHLQLLLAYQETYRGNFEVAKSSLIDLISSPTQKVVNFRANYLLIYIAAARNEWEDGLKYVEKVETLRSQITNVEFLQSAYIAIATFYSELEQYNLVLKYTELTKAQELTPYQQCTTQQLELKAKTNLDLLALDELEIEHALNTCQSSGQNLVANIIRSIHAKLLLQKNAPKKAISMLLLYLKDVEKINYPMLTAEINNIIAFSYLDMSNHNKAKFHATVANNVNKGQSIRQAADSYLILSKIAEHEKHYKLALDYFRKFATADKAYLDALKAKSLAFQLAQNKSFQQKTEIELLNQQNELLNNKNKLLTVEKSLSKSEVENTRLIAALLLAIVALLIFFGYRSWRTQKRLKRLAEYDYLTGIYNRGHFMELAAELTQYSEDAHQTLCCMLFDLDKFKSINDSYGHTTGDWVLKQSVLAIKHVIRDQDVFARLGGEEFCILLPSCDLQAATYVAEKCLASLLNIDTAVTGFDFEISASVGITTSKLSGFSISTLMAHADTAMYVAKDAGRNCLHIYSGE